MFDGRLVVIRTASGHTLSCTENHPVLTPIGWCCAGTLDVGGKVACSLVGNWTFAGNDDHNEVPSSIKEIVDAFGEACKVLPEKVEVAPEDFHGDGIGSKVAVVWADGLLRDSGYTLGGQHLSERAFPTTNVRGPDLPRSGSLASFLKRRLASTAGAMGSLGIVPTFLRGPKRHEGAIGFSASTERDAKFMETIGEKRAADPKGRRNPGDRLSVGVPFQDGVDGQVHAATDTRRTSVESSLNPSFGQSIPDRSLADAEGGRDLYLSLAGQVFADDVVSVDVIPFHGHVYNLQTQDGYYVAEGIVTHNCKCNETYRRKGSE
jgi:intein/homing endonuclease